MIELIFKISRSLDIHLGLQFFPINVFQVNPNSVSGQSGLKSGDGIIEICGENVNGWSHEAAKAAMVRAGNDVVFVVQR